MKLRLGELYNPLFISTPNIPPLLSPNIYISDQPKIVDNLRGSKTELEFAYSQYLYIAFSLGSTIIKTFATAPGQLTEDKLP